MATTSFNWNAGATTARRNLAATGRAMHRSIKQLSSGLKVQTSADDAANMAISITSRASIVSQEMAARNAEDAMAMLRTTDGAIQSIQDTIIRMRELAVQGATDTLNKSARKGLNTEYQTNLDELNRIFRSTEFNGISLLDGPIGKDYDPDGRIFHVGADAANANKIKFDLDFSTVFNAIQVENASGKNTLKDLKSSQTRIPFLDSLADIIQTERTKVGSTINRLEFATDNLLTSIENEKGSLSTRVDTDIAAASAEFTKNQVLMQAGVSMLSQANATPQMLLRLLG